MRFIKPQAGELVAMSDHLAHVFEKYHGVRPQHIIPNGIDPRWYSGPAHERNIDVLGVGSLIKLKQYNLSIELIASVKEKFPNIRALICGKGPEEHALLEQINQLKLTQNVSLAGEIQHPEVIRVMHRSKILLHTSDYEGYSTVCLEALYAGAHVISFCHPGGGPIPHWHTVENKEEMLEKLIELLENPLLEHEPTIVYTMKDSAKMVMELFLA